MNKLLENGMIDFSEREVPEWYYCQDCKARNCKLWRNRRDPRLRLLCADCAARDQGEEIVNMDANGCRPSRVLSHANTIGSCIPALPDFQFGGFWPENSAPSNIEKWWSELPNHEQRR